MRVTRRTSGMQVADTTSQLLGVGLNRGRKARKEVWTLEKVIAKLNPRPTQEDLHTDMLPSSEKLPLINKVQNANYPSMVIVDPKTHSVAPYSTTSGVSDHSLIPLGLEKSSQPPTLFFSVDGQVDMPVCSVEMLNDMARKDRQRQAGYAVPNKSCGKKKVAKVIPKKKSEVCHLCLRSFRGSYELKMHLRAHAGIRLWPCTLCEKRFYTRHYLARHIASMHGSSRDNGEIRIACPFCPRENHCEKYENKTYLRKHLLQNHDDKLQKIPE